MAFSPDGILFVSMPSKTGLYSDNRSGGTVFALPDRDRDGEVDDVRPVIAGLNNLPHGLAFYNGYLYLAAGDSISRSVGCQRFWTVLGPRDWGEEAPGLRVSLTS